MAYGVHEVGLAQAASAVEEEGIVLPGIAFGNGNRGSVCKPVVGAVDEAFEGVLGVKIVVFAGLILRIHLFFRDFDRVGLSEHGKDAPGKLFLLVVDHILIEGIVGFLGSKDVYLLVFFGYFGGGKRPEERVHHEGISVVHHKLNDLVPVRFEFCFCHI